MSWYIAAPGTHCDARMAYLGADIIIIWCCFLHITACLVRELADDDCCTDEGNPASLRTQRMVYTI